MPFVMAPLLWSRLCSRFRKHAVLHERAHGDGIAIGYDSPEAFEEVIWRAFWPEHFNSHEIPLWSATDINDDAREFMTRHFRKIVALRRKRGARPGRYISKNNANIARLDLIAEMFPDAVVARSAAQPARTCSLATASTRELLDGFTGKMHSRFATCPTLGTTSSAHCIAQFGSRVFARANGLKMTELDYWFAYWIAAFEHVARDVIGFILSNTSSFAAVEHRPRPSYANCSVSRYVAAPAMAAHFEPRPPPTPDLEAYRSPLRDRAEALHGSSSVVELRTRPVGLRLSSLRATPVVDSEVRARV